MLPLVLGVCVTCSVRSVCPSAEAVLQQLVILLLVLSHMTLCITPCILQTHIHTHTHTLTPLEGVCV